MLEHFHAWEALDLVKEWKRALEPGGALILELPCMDKVLHYVTHCMTKNLPMSPAFSWFVFWGDPNYRNEFMVHKWGYTKEMLRALLVDAGFVDIEFQEPRYHFKERDMRVVALKPSTT